MNGAYVTNHINADKVTCLHSFGVEHIPKLKKNYTVNKIIATYICKNKHTIQ